jgi:glycosyltransferase involved in cell wall biosynthesis
MRVSAGWSDRFVFLNVSALTLSKGTDLLLKAFAMVATRYPHALLVLKGTYDQSGVLLKKWMIEKLTSDERRAIAGRIQFVKPATSVNAVARLYRVADAYVTPYRSESFNLPALEAIASGLPIICTAGGPTDDYTRPDFAQRIFAKKVPGNRANEIVYRPDVEAIAFAMSGLIENDRFREVARAKGPGFVRNCFTWRHAVDRLLEVAGIN